MAKQPRHRRDRNVYILGAGFSVEASIPLVKDFLQRAQEAYDDPNSPLAKSLYQKYKEVFDFRKEIRRVKDVMNQNLNDIEVLFSLIDMRALKATSGAKTGQAVRHLIASTVSNSMKSGRKVRVLLTRSLVSKLRGRHFLLQHEFIKENSQPNKLVMIVEMEFYQVLVGVLIGAFEPRSRKTEDVIITFNYDLVVETALRAWGYRPDYAADNLKAAFKAEDGKKVTILKLHGSCNWAKSGSDKKWTRYYRGYDEVPAEKALVIVPPSWRKDANTGVLASVWRRALVEIEQASRICIIGYSMPDADAYFKYLLTWGLSDNPGMYKVLVVDYEQDSGNGIMAKYMKLFAPMQEYGRFQYCYHGGDKPERGVAGFTAGCVFHDLARAVAVERVIFMQ